MKKTEFENKGTIVQGECLEVMKTIPAGSVDLIICDPPYVITNCKWDVIIPFDRLWEQYNRILKPNGVVLLTGSQPFTTELINSNKKNFKYCYYWVKNRVTNFANAKKQPLRKVEEVVVFYKGKPTYNPQGLKRINKKVKNGKNVGGEQIDGVKERSHLSGIAGAAGQTYVQEFTGYPNQVLNFPSDKEKLHPTMKPVSLFEFLIKTHSNEGELVMDNCAGSFTTAIACLNSNRKFFCIDFEERYFNIGRERIERALEGHKTELKKAA